ncbi:hypothetical protein GJ699_17280 [Duganella sp. FT80W]|uniref:DUF2189 domain-containing protein n=1 Tax=Duganella guangzhouensis TaxID=2666084 RepID=A0A6I2L630_9BURK|nr:BPSS1780 family membrane protein [Duganella guangzhouensis]MRW91749.1 hypothetical protein [Duganella guangzhouensis]
MDKLPARTGWLWVKQGLDVFRKQPGALMALLFSCMFLSMIAAVLPIVGGLLPSLLAPLFSVALLQACADVDQGKRALPFLVAIGFKKPMRRPLLQLGGLYVALTVATLVVLRLMGDDIFAQLASSDQVVRLDRDMLENLRLPLLVSSLVYLIGWMLLCLAAPLIYWQKMAVGKALFFSVVTVGREFKAFITAAVMLYLLCQVLTLVPLLLLGLPSVAVALLFGIVLMMMMLVHCTLYASYRQIFGTPPASPEALNLNKP